MKKNRKLASIIIPVLNEEKYIEACINSIVLSTKKIEDMELIIVDGGSDDDTLRIIKGLIKIYPYIKLFHNGRQTTPISLNIGINNSSGKYIIRLDAHAEYAPGYINKCIISLDSSSNDVANVGGEIITKPGSNSLISNSIAKFHSVHLKEKL
jgi:succinoglycan biosynthesis protein ExoA